MNFPTAKLRRVRAFALLIIMLMAVGLFWQNCSNVNLEQDLPSTTANGIESSYLQIDNSDMDVFRAVFVLDMSNSMFSGPCPGSVDVMIDNVTPSENCLGPTGVDPEGKRFQLILKWLNSLEKRIEEQKVSANQVKALVLPFANALHDIKWDTSNSTSPLSRILAILNQPSGLKFRSVAETKILIYVLWAMISKFHDYPYSNDIPANIVAAVDNNFNFGTNSNASSGTSIIDPALEDMNQKLHAELEQLKTQNLVGKAHFELVFLSDGVPKPHALHIEAAAKLVWAAKRDIRDTSLCGDTYDGGNGSYYCSGWTGADGSSCFSRCADHLKVYTDTGAVNLPLDERPYCTTWYTMPNTCSGYSDGSSPYERWTNKIKCGQCFELLRQFNMPKESCPNNYYCMAGYSDEFKNKSTYYWGDWLLNRHSRIIGKLKSAENIFKIQFPGSNWRFSFLRIDSSTPAYKTQTGELIKDLNWIEKAKDYYAKKQRFYVVEDSQPPFSLFYELENGQSYELAMIYVYSRNSRANLAGVFEVDSDGDGLPDSQEGTTASLVARADGKCLDSIKARYSACITVSCNPSLDFDGDGLNQCEEKTIGTDEFDPDSDGDFIIDGAEVLFRTKTNENDQITSTNIDGFTNFQHFIKGFSPLTNLSLVPINRQILISSNLINHVLQKDSRGFDVRVPGYSIRADRIPISDTKASSLISVAGNNQIVAIIRVDNHANPSDKIWLSKVYEVSGSQTQIKINLGDFNKLRLGSP